MRTDPFDRLLPLIAFVAASLAFIPTLWNGFVDWGDYATLVHNEHYRGLGTEQVAWMFTNTDEVFYQPLTWLSYAVDHEFWGMRPVGYHLTSVLLHAFTAAMVTSAALRLIPRAIPDLAYQFPIVRGAAVAAGLLWASHPLRVESVAWASARPDVLSGALLMLSLGFYLSQVRHKALGEHGAVLLRYFLSIFTYALAMLASPSAVTWAVVLLLADAAMGRKAPWRQRLLEKIPFVVIALPLAIVALANRGDAAAGAALEHLGAMDRLMLAGFSVAFYPAKTLLPLWLRAHYELPEPFDAMAPEIVGGASVAALTTVVTLVLYRRRPRLAQAWWAYVLLIASPALFPTGSHLVAERTGYIATIPLFIAFAGAGALWVSARPARRSRHALTALACAVLAFSAVSVWVTLSWKDTGSVFERVLAHEPHNGAAHQRLGHIAAGKGELAEARDHLRALLETHPHAPPAERIKLAWIEGELGQPEEAVRIVEDVLTANPNDLGAIRLRGELHRAAGDLHRAGLLFLRALEIDPDDTDALAHLASVEIRRGKDPDAKVLVDRCLDRDPNHAEGWHLRARLLSNAGDVAGAEHAYRRSIELGPTVAGPVQDLATLLAQGGDPSQAERYYQEALKLDDRLTECRLLLGALLERQQLMDKAEAVYRAAMDRDPAHKEPAARLGALLARRGRGAEAEQILRKAYEIDPEDPAILTSLARVLGNGGRLEEAVELLEKAASILADDAGPLLQLAVLLERNGRLATARRRAGEALAVAERTQDARALELAQQLVERIPEPK